MGNKIKTKKANFIAKNILTGSLNVSALIFKLFMELSEETISAFLSPSIYKDMPDSAFDSHKEFAKIKSKFNKTTIKQSIGRLRKQGFVEKVNNKFILTEYGKSLAGYILEREKLLKNKWDGKFRIVIFDIPEKMRGCRDWFRQELYILKYRKLQESVFVGKYPLPSSLIKDIKNRKMGNYVNYLLVDKIYKNLS